MLVLLPVIPVREVSWIIPIKHLWRRLDDDGGWRSDYGDLVGHDGHHLLDLLRWRIRGQGFGTCPGELVI